MANVPPILASYISELPAGPDVLDGTELLEIQAGEVIGSSQQVPVATLSKAAKEYSAQFFATAEQGDTADSAVQVVTGADGITVDASNPTQPVIGYDFTGRLQGVNDQVGPSYTVVAADAGKEVRCTNAAPVVFNVDTQANIPMPEQFWCLLSQGGAGKVTVTALAGVTLRAPNGADTTVQYDARGLQRIVGDEWRVW